MEKREFVGQREAPYIDGYYTGTFILKDGGQDRKFLLPLRPDFLVSVFFLNDDEKI